MLSYCSKCTKNTKSKNPKVERIKKRRRIVLSKYATCDRKKSKVVKHQVTSVLLSSLVMKAPLSKIPLVGPLLF